jgi:hypothetical protein
MPEVKIADAVELVAVPEFGLHGIATATQLPFD